MLATCRRQGNHGHFAGSIEEQCRVLSSAITSGARAVDLEIESAEVRGVPLDDLRRARFIVSYHNWESTPALDPVVQADDKDRRRHLQAGHHGEEALRHRPRAERFEAGRTRSKWVLLAMGDTGFPTRVLAPAAGFTYTYAAPSCVEGTASGQVSARTLRHLYRVEKITRAAKIFGVIADPVKHSISPAVHNRGFQAQRLDAVYLPFLVPPPNFAISCSRATNSPSADSV